MTTLAEWLERGLSRWAKPIALSGEGESLSYEELERRSRSCAAALLGLLPPGAGVSFHGAKSLPLCTAILGAVRAGVPYCVLDPSWPPERKRELAGLCSPRLCVEFEPGERAFGDSGVPVLPAERLAGHDEFRTRAEAGGTAYWLFTSGSTGRPKAVQISQKAALGFARWAAERAGLEAGSVVASSSSLQFDLSVFDLFSSLASGARVALLPAGLGSFPAELARRLRQEGVTHWYSVPSTVRLLAESGGESGPVCPSLRVLLCAGDVFPLEEAKRLRRQSGCRLWNFFGPTETNVCLAYELPEEQAAPVPVGYPAAALDCRILTAEDELRESGEGELLVAGDAVCDGYLGPGGLDPGPRFVAGGRSYFRTGDQVRRESAGAPFFSLGRRDEMVKVWGHRVYPAELEAALAQITGLPVAVLTLPDARQGSRLLAFVERPEAPEEELAERWMEAVRARLPGCFLPESIRALAKFPLNANGKVDRAALRLVRL